MAPRAGASLGGRMGNFSVRQADGVFYLSGELDMAEVETFVCHTADALDGGGPVTLDLEGLTFMDSSGVHAIMGVAERCADRGLVLRLPRAEVAKVLKIVGMAQVPGIEIRADDRPEGGPGAWSAWEATRSTTLRLVQDAVDGAERAKTASLNARELIRLSAEARAERGRAASAEPA
jgi:anti-anti-sigma factor